MENNTNDIKNSICSWAVVMGNWGWGGNPDVDANTPEKAYARLDAICDKRALLNEFEKTTQRNSCLLKAIHFQDRKLYGEIGELSSYMSKGAVVDQVFQAYHRHNLILDTDNVLTEETKQFPELPNVIRDPSFLAIEMDSARQNLEGLSLEGLLGEMAGIDSKNDSLLVHIHDKEEAIGKYLEMSQNSLNVCEMQSRIKEAYWRNHSIYQIYQAVTKAEEYLGDVTRQILLDNDAKLEFN